VPSIPPDARRSLKSLIIALHNLPPLTLTAQIIGPSSGRPPFAPDFTVSPSSGATIETVLNYFKDGVALPPHIPLTLANGTDISAGNIVPSTFNEPGHYEAVIARAGITSEGFTTLVRRIPFNVNTPAPPPVGPTCSVELGLHGSPGSSVTQMRIFGGGFVSNEQIQILEGTRELAVVQADVFGSYSVEIGFLHGPQPTQHAVMAHGVQSGLNSNTAGFSV
jgi:hypothetical protein